MVADELQAEIDRLHEDLEETEAALTRAERELQDLRFELESIKHEWYSPEEHELRLVREMADMENDLLADRRREFGQLADDAHHFLSDLAWRATVGDPVARAVEAEVGPFLKGFAAAV